MLISRTDRGYSQSSRVRTLVISFVVLIILFFILKPFIQSPLLGAAGWVKDIFADKTVETLRLENEDLKNQIGILKIGIATASSAEDMINMGVTDFIKASVVVKSMSSVYGNVYINQGKDSGVNIDALVFAPGLFPIGKVVGTDNKFARIELLTASGKKVGGLVKLASSSEEVIELEGDGSYGFVATIPFNSKIKNGDNIYMSESPDFVMGTVVDVILNENENNKIVRVRGYYSTLGTGTVFVQK